QEEVIKYITEHSISKTITRGSTQHMISFAQEFADYLASLKGQVSRGLISSIEKEIEEHYRDNITLKSLGDKYYINSSYLGQLFRKAHDMSFKDYLTKVRVEKAVNLLVSTSEKIERIAEEVGYSDSDYFIRKFIELKGCTPSKYRRNNSVH
ncbi:MAG: helix-turn-helix domain-containing protein, partial [Pseudobutyrivibrio sp.]|nr:helix-turn-helix domain-containing protein [Pseudobutyrivibrio sp.]